MPTGGGGMEGGMTSWKPASLCKIPLPMSMYIYLQINRRKINFPNICVIYVHQPLPTLTRKCWCLEPPSAFKCSTDPLFSVSSAKKTLNFVFACLVTILPPWVSVSRFLILYKRSLNSPPHTDKYPEGEGGHIPCVFFTCCDSSWWTSFRMEVL